MSQVNNDIDDMYVPCLDKDEKNKKQGASTTDVVLMLSQIGLLVIWTVFARFDQGVLPGTTKAPTNSNVYPCFQDVNVMIFIGFGYLMTYIKAQGQSALSFNWIVSIWCIQWGILS